MRRSPLIPSHNLEVKARLLRPARVMRVASALAGNKGEQLTQTDVYFRVPRGRLKLRTVSGSQRSRNVRSEVIYYVRPATQGLRDSFYCRIPVVFPRLWRIVFGALFGFRGIVKKSRRLFLYGSTRIHIDQVDGLGAFLELEHVLERREPAKTGGHRLQRVLGLMGVRRQELVGGSYIDLREGAVRTSLRT